jgi:hypothetical protein
MFRKEKLFTVRAMQRHKYILWAERKRFVMLKGVVGVYFTCFLFSDAFIIDII